MNRDIVVQVFVGFLGIGSALLTGFLAGRWQARLEYQKEVRLAIAQLTGSMGVATHTMSWFTWKAKHRPSLLASDDAKCYDTDMKEVYPDLVGSLAVLAALSQEAYLLASEAAASIYALDDRVAQAATGLLTEQTENAAEELARLYPEARWLEDSSKKMAPTIMAEVR